MSFFRSLVLFTALSFAFTVSMANDGTDCGGSRVGRPMVEQTRLAEFARGVDARMNAFGPEVHAYSSHPKIAHMLSISKSEVKRDYEGNCLIRVLEAISGSGLPGRWSAPNRYNENYWAKSTLKNLKSANWTNMLEAIPSLDAYSAPPGAILVYSGSSPTSSCTFPSPSNKDCGHVEIRSKDGFISDTFKRDPITKTTPSGNYQLIGIMILRPPHLK